MPCEMISSQGTGLLLLNQFQMLWWVGGPQDDPFPGEPRQMQPPDSPPGHGHQRRQCGSREPAGLRHLAVL